MKHPLIPDPNTLFPNDYGTSCFIKNAVTAPNIQIGDYTTTTMKTTRPGLKSGTSSLTIRNSATG